MKRAFKLTYSLRSGKGGNGAIHFATEPFKRIAPADGGDGGAAGDVVLRVVSHQADLRSVMSKFGGNFALLRSQEGMKGTNNRGRGRRGDDLVIDIPKGTSVKCLQSDLWIDTGHPLVPEGCKFVVLAGARGGLGNSSFNALKYRSVLQDTKDGEELDFPVEPEDLLPQSNFYNPFSWATKGEQPPEAAQVTFESMMLGDVGLIGLPNSGKSSFLEAVCPGRDDPDNSGVGDYPFTTLNARLGHVKLQEGKELRITDLPGLIKDAHIGKGLGLEFLSHAQKCRLLVYMIDLSGQKPVEQFRLLKHEVDTYFDNLKSEAYSWRLLSRKDPFFVLANKADIVESRAAYEDLVKFCSQEGIQVVPVSAKYRKNLEPALDLMYDMVVQSKQQEKDYWSQCNDKVKWIANPSIVRNVVNVEFA